MTKWLKIAQINKKKRLFVYTNTIFTQKQGRCNRDSSSLLIAHPDRFLKCIN